MSRSSKPSPKALAFAKALHNAIATQREIDRKNAKGKAMYLPSLDALLPFGVAWCDVAPMPSEVFYGTPTDRRVWCEENNVTVVDVATVCEKVGARCDNTLRQRIEAWNNIGLLPMFSYMRVRPLSSATATDTKVYVYRVNA
jgi:hypothetical protein